MSKNYSNRPIKKGDPFANSNKPEYTAMQSKASTTGLMVLQSNPQMRGPNPLVPMSKQQPLYDPTHRYN